MLTYQDFLKADDLQAFIMSAIYEHKNSDDVKTAQDADLYDLQRNKTINDYTKVLWTITGSQVVDFTASNAKIASNFFHRLNTQRVTYLLGNGVFFICILQRRSKQHIFLHGLWGILRINTSAS